MEHINQTSGDNQNPVLAGLLTATPTAELAHMISVFYQIDMTARRLLELGVEHPDRPLAETASTDAELELEARAIWIASTLLTLPSVQPATLGAYSMIAQWAGGTILNHLSEGAYVQLQNFWAAIHNDQEENI